MCGICGIYTPHTSGVDYRTLQKMTDAIVHRGPDDSGYFIDKSIGLGMRRLSIIDLESGHQPIYNEDETIWIIFNGEIYNYKMLRPLLEQNGHQFSTESDTEVILHLYEDFGEDCVSRLNGMFAFAIWDSTKKRLFLARDRIGIKPLHYAEVNDGIIFGSEIKSILQDQRVLRKVNSHALRQYLGFEYVPGSETMFQGIFKLLPGHILTFDHNGLSIREYWDLNYPEKITYQPLDVLTKILGDRLKKSIEMRMISDVPLGAFLSGGIDSSSIVGIMSEISDQPVRTFSIGFDDESYNELNYARKVAELFNTEHREAIITPDVVDLVHTIIRYLDEPLADVSVFPTYLVSQLAASNVKVVLSGDGGDEIFAGYDWYKASKADSYYHRLPRTLRNSVGYIVNAIPPTKKKKGLVNEIKRFVEGVKNPDALHHIRWQYFITDNEPESLMSEEHRKSDLQERLSNPVNFYYVQNSAPDRLSREQFVDIKMYLPDDILVKVDRMSMANSLEVRVPFLDYSFVEFAATIPSNLKLRGMVSKYILKKTMARMLPNEILYRKKQGFSIPMKNWLKDELQDLMFELLSARRMRESGFFNEDYTKKIIQQHIEGKRNNAHQIWSLMLFNLWREKYILQENAIA
jgi:asparagine synthase (glutamine-hydrolysing)